MIKLSICIATYNRADMIGETLNSIITQIRTDVEIVVVDGASTDATPDIMRLYQERCPAIQYHRMPLKGGVDQDYCHAVSFATGEYCWLLTDDDVVKPGAINTILSHLAKQISLVILDAEVWDKQLTTRVKAKQLPIERDKFYEPSSRELLFTETLSYLSFIGAVVIDRSLWNERIKEPYLGTEFIHIGVIFQKVLPRGAFVVSKPCIRIRYGNAQWSPRHFEIWMFKWPDLVWSFSGISDEAKSRICPRNPWNDIITLLLQRAFGAYSLAGFRKFIKPRLAGRGRLLMLKSVALVPGFLLNALAVLYYTIVSSQDYFLWHNLTTSRFYYKRHFVLISQSLKKFLFPRRSQTLL
jgi:abequosyltransferase